jgi:hypothetical protein
VLLAFTIAQKKMGIIVKTCNQKDKAGIGSPAEAGAQIKSWAPLYFVKGSRVFQSIPKLNKQETL